MTGTLKIVINSLQTPTSENKLTMVELRAKAMQQLGMEPAKSTPESTEGGAATVTQNVNTQSTQGE